MGDGCDDDILDLMQVVAMLLIPTLLKAAAAEERRMRRSNRRSTTKSWGQSITHRKSLKLMRHSSASTEAIARQRRSKAKVVPPPPDLLDTVLKMILHDAVGSSEPQKLDVILLKRIFTAYGENEIASNDALLEDMVACADVVDEIQQRKGILDAYTFAMALTSDVQLYDTSSEVRLSTYFQDVFEHESFNTESDLNEDERTIGTIRDHDEVGRSWKLDPKVTAHKVELRFTAPSIDITAATYRSKGLMAFLWATMLISYYVYAYRFALTNLNAQKACSSAGINYQFSLTRPWLDNADAIGCEIYTSIKLWNIFFLIMTAQGTILISLGSMGNYLKSPLWKPVVGGTVVATYVATLFAFFFHKLTDAQELFLSLTSLALGSVTLCYHAAHIITLLISRTASGRRLGLRRPRIATLLSTSQVRSEMHLKLACSRKVSNMVQNALNIVRVNDKDHVALNTHFAQALDVYSKSGRQYKKIGGFKWSLKRLFTGTVYEKDGVWISTRLIACNFAQYIVALYILLGGIALIQTASSFYDSGKQYTLSYVSQGIVDAVEIGVVQKFSETITLFFSSFLGNTSHAFKQACKNIGNTVIASDSNLDGFCRVVYGNNTFNSTMAAASTAWNASGISEFQRTLSDVSIEILNAALESTVNSLYPSQKYMLMVPVVVGTGEFQTG